MHNMQQVLLVAAVAGADPRTVKRFLAGGPTRPSVVARIEHALAELGFASPRPRGEETVLAVADAR